MVLVENNIITVKYLDAKCYPRFLEDASVWGGDYNEMPCLKDGCWNPIIDIETGVITNWVEGVIADIFYKVCDDGTYTLKDADEVILGCFDEMYVPKCLSPEREGFGDYIHMRVDEFGKIKDWKFDVKQFTKE